MRRTPNSSRRASAQARFSRSATDNHEQVEERSNVRQEGRNRIDLRNSWRPDWRTRHLSRGVARLSASVSQIDQKIGGIRQELSDIEEQIPGIDESATRLESAIRAVGSDEEVARIGRLVDLLRENPAEMQTLLVAMRAPEIPFVTESGTGLYRFSFEKLTANRESKTERADVNTASAYYLHVLDDAGCFLVAMQLPTGDENSHWREGVAEKLVHGNSLETRATETPSTNLFQRYRVASGSDSKEAIRIFSLVTDGLEGVDLPERVDFYALLACPTD